MNRIQLETIPPGEFETISAFTPDWENQFLQLVEQKKHIKYVLNELPNIPNHLQDALSRNNYCDCLLKDDDWQHFLVVKP